MKTWSFFIFWVCISVQSFGQVHIDWGQEVVLNDPPVLNYAGDSLSGPQLDYRSSYGSEYGRMLELENGTWLAAYTISRNYGYMIEPEGGFELRIARSLDNGRNWEEIGLISEPGRDLDNAQLIQLPNGSIVLACRSVRWQESYRLPVYRSTDEGRSWSKISTIDSNEGEPGELGEPDKGVYEPHLLFLEDGRLAVAYANEKHVTGQPSYSQIISQKISEDFGRTWGEEIWAVYEEGKNSSRPGMPVWTRMKNGSYMLVYEICGPEHCHVYYKKSEDGIHWPIGLGTKIPDQIGGPYILSLDDGTLVVTSNLGNISTSTDFGRTWHQTERPWTHEKDFDRDWTQTIWSSLYQMGPDEIAILTTVQREEGGHSMRLRFGKIKKDKTKQ